MIHGTHHEHVPLVIPASVSTSGSTTTLDTYGLDFVSFCIAVNTASSDLAALALAEGDTTSAYTAIAAYTGGTATSTSVGFVIPSADTTNGVFVKMNVPLAGRKRYLQLTIDPGVAAVVYAWAEVLRQDVTPTTDAGLGWDEIVNPA